MRNGVWQWMVNTRPSEAELCVEEDGKRERSRY